MNSHGQKMSRKHKATFQLVSDTLSARYIAETLKIEGATILEKGQKVSDRPGARTMERAMWQLESKLSAEAELADHILSLVNLIEGKLEQLKALQKNCETEMWCFISTQRSQCGFALEPELIKKLSVLSVTLIFDVYS